MSTTTLAIVNAPTLQGGLVELLRIADALTEATRWCSLDGLGCGVSLYRDPEDGRLLEVEADPELPAGVLETAYRLPIGDPWAEDGHPTGLPPVDPDVAARRELLELLANVTNADIIATAKSVELL